jgi:fucose permease
VQKTFSRDRLTWLTYLFMAFYAYYINIIGPITPFLKDELHLSYTISSLHYSVFAFGILLVGLGGNWVIARLGRLGALWIGAAGLSAGTLLLIAGKTPVLTIAAAFLMGLVGSLILIIVPSVLSDRHGEMRSVALTEANMISSLVATSTPLLVGVFARTGSGWRLALGVVAFTPLLLYIIFRDTRSTQGSVTTNGDSHSSHPLPRLYWIYWLCLVLAVAVEFCMISWSADYIETVLGIPQVDAAQAVSIFFVAMIIGRVVTSRLIRRISPPQFLPASVLVAIIGFLLYWQAANVSVTLIGLFLIGFGIAGLYPLILSLAIGAAGTEIVQASTRATLASGVAILALPLVLGRLADMTGIRQAYGVVLLLLVSVLVIIMATSQSARTQTRG